MVADTIHKEIVIPAAPERVWETLTQGQHVGVWFGNGQETRIDLRPGGQILFDHGHGDVPADIERVKRPQVLSYRWAVIGDAGERARKGNSTLVTIRLTGGGGETTLHLTEAGFSGVEAPADQLEARYDANDAGWTRILDGLREYVAGLDGLSDVVPRAPEALT